LGILEKCQTLSFSNNSEETPNGNNVLGNSLMQLHPLHLRELSSFSSGPERHFIKPIIVLTETDRTFLIGRFSGRIMVFNEKF